MIGGCAIDGCTQ